MVFDKCCLRRGSLLWDNSESCQLKISLWIGPFREWPGRSVNDNSLEMWPRTSSSLVLPAISHLHPRFLLGFWFSLWFQAAHCWAGEGCMERRQIKCQSVFLNKCFLDCCKHKVNFDNVCHCSSCFYGGEDFQNSLVYHSHW